MTVIVNNTPWNTEDLERLLLPMFTGCGIIEATIKLMPPRTSRWRKHEHLSRVYFTSSSSSSPKDKVTIDLLSPKRAAARSEALDRLSLCEDLKAHETKLPSSVIATVEHAFIKLREAHEAVRKAHDQYVIRNAWSSVHSCMYGSCGCEFPRESVNPVVVRGDTKVRTHASPSEKTEEDLMERRRELEKLQKRAQSAACELRQQAAGFDQKAAVYDEKIQKLDERIIKVRAKAAMSVPIGPHQDGEEDDDEGQQEAE